LPPELRTKILKALCVAIIAEFETLKDSIDFRRTKKPNPKFHNPSQWHSPNSLKSFHSALLTSHEFNDTIEKIIKINGRSPRDVLLEKQAETVRTMTTKIEDMDPTNYPTMAWYCKTAGYFWRNPLVINDPELLPLVLRWMDGNSGNHLIPHLEPWLDQHAAEDDTYSESDAYIMISPVDNEKRTMEDCFYATVQGSIKGVQVVHQYVTTGNKFVRKEDEDDMEREETLGEKDVNSSPDWWCFWKLAEEMESEDAAWDWVFINYKVKRMYLGEITTAIKYHDIWDERTWERVKTLEELK
jgi:hypothetical protein